MPLNSLAVSAHLRAYARDEAATSAGRGAGVPGAPAARVPEDVDEIFLIGLYDQVLGREPDAAGLAGHLDALRAGLARADLAERVAASEEAAHAVGRGLVDGTVPDADRLVAHGLAVVAGVAPTRVLLDGIVPRLQRGVPVPVLLHALTGGATPEPWQSVLTRHLLHGLPAAADPVVVDRVLAKVGAFEEPEAILAVVLGGRSPVTRLRRLRRASRAVTYATLELASRARPTAVTSDASASVPVAELQRLLARAGSVERSAAPAAPQGAQVRVVEVDSMLIGVPVDEWRLAAYLEHRGHPEPGLSAIMLGQLTTGGTFVDVGANLGLYTVAAARLVGPTGHVVALEPTPRTARVLRENIQLNGLLELGTVDVHECAAGAAAGTARLALHDADSGHNSLYADEGTTGTVEVDVVRLDDLVPVGTRVDVVKIDVEGAELEVLEGMRRVAQDNPSVVVFAELADEHLRRAGSSAAALVDAATRLGWEHDVLETVSGEPAELPGTGVPLTVRLVRMAQAAS